MAYQLYRNTTLGNSLQESLDELIQSQQITPQLALQVLLQFDKAINSALAQRVRNRVNFRGSLNTYRFCDNVWTFVLNDVEFREVTELIKVDKVKIVACDGKNTGSNTTEWVEKCGFFMPPSVIFIAFWRETWKRLFFIYSHGAEMTTLCYIYYPRVRWVVTERSMWLCSLKWPLVHSIKKCNFFLMTNQKWLPS